MATRCQDGTFSAIQQQEERTRLSIQEISQPYKGRVRRTAFGCSLSIARSFVTVGRVDVCSVLEITKVVALPHYVIYGKAPNISVVCEVQQGPGAKCRLPNFLFGLW